MAGSGHNNPPPPTLTEVITTLRTLGKTELPKQLARWLDELDETGRWALLKLVTGAMRIGISARLAKTAAAALGDKDPHDVELLWPGLTPPYLELFAWLEGRGEKPVTRGEGKLLSGLVCCGSCGGRMSADRNRHGSFYRCRNRIVSVSGCPQPATISGKLIEPHVVEAALALLPTLAHKPQGEDGLGAAELEQALAQAEANLA